MTSNTLVSAGLALVALVPLALAGLAVALRIEATHRSATAARLAQVDQATGRARTEQILRREGLR